MYDVVITTYNIVALDARTPDKSVLMTTKWLRVILDEAHLIKNGSSKWSRACCELNAKYRLCLTGTPVQNSMQDLGSLLKFLRIRPYNRRGVFSKIEKRLRAMQKKGNDTGAAKAWAPIGLLLRSLMLRRRKHEVPRQGLPYCYSRSYSIVRCCMNFRPGQSPRLSKSSVPKSWRCTRQSRSSRSLSSTSTSRMARSLGTVPISS